MVLSAIKVCLIYHLVCSVNCTLSNDSECLNNEEDKAKTLKTQNIEITVKSSGIFHPKIYLSLECMSIC